MLSSAHYTRYMWYEMVGRKGGGDRWGLYLPPLDRNYVMKNCGDESYFSPLYVIWNGGGMGAIFSPLNHFMWYEMAGGLKLYFLRWTKQVWLGRELRLPPSSRLNRSSSFNTILYFILCIEQYLLWRIHIFPFEQPVNCAHWGREAINKITFWAEIFRHVISPMPFKGNWIFLETQNNEFYDRLKKKLNLRVSLWNVYLKSF